MLKLFQLLIILRSWRPDFRFLAFRAHSRFVYCLLRKNKRSSDLPVIEKWGTYMLQNHSSLGPIEEEIFLKMTRLLTALEKVKSNFLKTSSEETAAVSWRILTAKSSPPLPLALWLGKGSNFFARRVSLEVTTTLLFTSLTNCSMGYWKMAGLEDEKLRLPKLNFLPSFVGSDKWKRARLDHVLQSAVSLHSVATNMASAIAVTFPNILNG